MSHKTYMRRTNLINTGHPDLYGHPINGQSLVAQQWPD